MHQPFADVVLALCAPFLTALIPPPVAAPARASSTRGATQLVTLESLSGEVSTKPLDGFETTDPRQLGAWSLRFDNPSVPIGTGADVADVHLAHGERLIGSVRRGAGESLEVDVAPGVHASATLDGIQSIRFAGRIPSGWNAPLEAPKEGDRLYRRKGDAEKNATVERIEGGVESFSDEGLVFHDARVGSLSVKWEDVVALFVESAAGSPAAHPAGTVPVVVDLVDATRLAGKLARIDARGLTLERWSGETLLLPLSVLSFLVVDDGQLVFLSDLPPSDAQAARPFGDDLGMSWPHCIDASVTGTPLVVGGRAFARGIGVHAPSRITWKLDGAYATLRGEVGVDDSVQRLAAHGSVRFRVLVDGQKRFETRTLSGGDAPVPIVLEPASLSGAKELVLEADMAEDSFVADRADWLQVVLVRAGAPK